LTPFSLSSLETTLSEKVKDYGNTRCKLDVITILNPDVEAD